MTSAYMAHVDLFPPGLPGEEAHLAPETVELQAQALIALRALSAAKLGWTLEEVSALEAEEEGKFYGSLAVDPPAAPEPPERLLPTEVDWWWVRVQGTTRVVQVEQRYYGDWEPDGFCVGELDIEWSGFDWLEPIPAPGRLAALIAENKMLRSELTAIIRNVTHGRRSLPAPRWAHLREVGLHGSTVSAQMVRDAGLDPDQNTGWDGEGPCPLCAVEGGGS
jgi:hypothetical protein